MALYTVGTVVLAGILVIMLIRLRRSLARFRIKKNYTAAIDAPSVSVCIPARNETHAMTECLERVLASDYKKLEIIVFDDSSTDDTSILIRSFAHAGVRFVPGTDLPAGWLGKNHALEVLAREASGTYVIFMDVDTRIRPTTISQLVGYTMTEKMQMVSILPSRFDSWRPSVLFGHLRYFWELVLSREKAPATSSALWLIERQTLLEKFGGFAPFKSYVAPEMILARLLGTSAYHCLCANATLGVGYEKRWTSQLETSRRLLYPQMGGTWMQGVVAFLLLAVLNLPFFVVVAGLVTGWSVGATVALVLLAGFMLLYGNYTRHVWAKAWWLGALLWPVIIFQELCLFVWSIWGYARGTITWKGRPVSATPTAAKR